MYPALAVLQELENNTLKILWVGGEGGMEQELVGRAGYEIYAIPAAGLHGVGLRALPGNLITILKGYIAARKLLRSFAPDALFFTGGFVAAPIALAGVKIPTLAFVPDIKPGFALRLISRFADKIAIVDESSKNYFSNLGRLKTTGYPLRKELSTWKQENALKHFSFGQQLKTLLIFGGSKGAQSINLALQAALPTLLEKIQIIHISGTGNWDSANTFAKTLPEKLMKNYRLFPYLHEDMGAALSASNLVLSRAGASILGEYPLFKLPAILVPIPMEAHIQHLNAAYMEKKGAAQVLPDGEMSEKLSQTVIKTINDDAMLKKMSLAMQKLARPNAAKDIAAMLLEINANRQKEYKTA